MSEGPSGKQRLGHAEPPAARLVHFASDGAFTADASHVVAGGRTGRERS